MEKSKYGSAVWGEKERPRESKAGDVDKKTKGEPLLRQVLTPQKQKAQRLGRKK